MKRRILFGISFLLLTTPILLVACGGDDDGVAPQPTPTPTVVTMFASLDNTQEAPSPTASTAKGFGMLTLDTATNRISGFIVDTVANATAAHIHGPAARGTPAGVLVPMIPAGPGLWVLPDNAVLPAANAADFANGLLYYNVHNDVNPGGDIRGQIDRKGTAIQFASLDNTQEAPSPTASTAKGFGILGFDPATNRIAGAIFDDVANATAAHIHGPAARGTPAGVLVGLNPAGPGLWVLPDNAVLPAANAADFTNGLLYYNVHNDVNPGGDIRGQIDRP